jgi:hypothetical protein
MKEKTLIDLVNELLFVKHTADWKTCEEATDVLMRQHTALQDLQTECAALRVNEENLTAQVESLRAQLEQKSERIAHLEATASSNYGRGHADAQLAARVPDDVATHRQAWMAALVSAKASAANDADELYWQHEIKVFDRVFDGLLSAAPSQQANHETPDGWVGCVMVGHAKHHGGWCVLEETAPGEYVKIKGPFDTKELAQEAMRTPAPSQKAPVAWVNSLDEPQPHCVTSLRYCSAEAVMRGDERKYIPLYTTPQQASEPMTSEELWPIVSTARVELFDLAQQWADNKIHSYQFAARAEQIVGAAVREAERHHNIKGKQ